MIRRALDWLRARPWLAWVVLLVGAVVEVLRMMLGRRIVIAAPPTSDLEQAAAAGARAEDAAQEAYAHQVEAEAAATRAEVHDAEVERQAAILERIETPSLEGMTAEQMAAEARKAGL